MTVLAGGNDHGNCNAARGRELIDVAGPWEGDQDIPKRYLLKLADAMWRHQNAGNWATLGAIQWACMAISGDAAARKDLDENPAWALHRSGSAELEVVDG